MGYRQEEWVDLPMRRKVLSLDSYRGGRNERRRVRGGRGRGSRPTRRLRQCLLCRKGLISLPCSRRGLQRGRGSSLGTKCALKVRKGPPTGLLSVEEIALS